ncbi:hypothetical protein [Butyrivibrio proteoclasticus]|uniref:hypothetical protein n=1 Tax=Butyrivibrio proteoclasticus TaxID=43305 RepID=UPI00047C1A82|nr:hypothetical protein [Butyrivibrio proteoclasticus]
MLNIPEEVKDLFKQDGIQKNLRVVFVNGENPDLTNEDIVMGSFSMTESLCSQDKIKFGLCEASVVEFECHGVGNVKGASIDVSIEIDCSSLGDEWCAANAQRKADVGFPFYSVSYGRFAIDSCDKQSGNGIRKVIAYNRIAQKNWEWVKPFKELIECSSWYLNEPLKFSYKDIKRMIEPEWAAQNGEYPLRRLSETGRDAHRFEHYYLPGEQYQFFTVTVYYKYQWYFDGKFGVYTARATKPKVFAGLADKISKMIEEESTGELYNLYTYRANTVENILNLLSPIALMKPRCGYERSDDADVSTTITPRDVKEIIIPIGEEFTTIPAYKKEDFYVTNPKYCYSAFCSTQITMEEGKFWAWGNPLQFFVPYRVRVSHEKKGILLDTGEIEGCDVEYTFHEYEEDPNVNLLIQPFTKKCNVYTGKMDTKPTASTRTDYKYVLPDNLREIFEGFLEINGEFGFYGRDGIFSERKLKGIDGTFPSESLYPSNSKYATDIGSDDRIRKAMYEKAEYADEETPKYSKVILAYKDADNEDQEAAYNMIDEYIAASDPDKYQSYSLSFNKLLDELSPGEEKSVEFCRNFGETIKNVRYMPSRITMRGLPYLEAGDLVHVDTDDGGFNTYILRRTLKGIQTLTDEIEAR